jgi:hypothetical protein
MSEDRSPLTKRKKNQRLEPNLGQFLDFKNTQNCQPDRVEARDKGEEREKKY